MATAGMAASSATTDGGILNRLIKLITIIAVVAIIIWVLIVVVGVITYREQIISFLTTGFIGYLNPFDSPAGDSNPVSAAKSEIRSQANSTGIPHLWHTLTSPFRMLFK